MRVSAAELFRAFDGQGARFEQFVFDLLHEVARGCGVGANAIQRDLRTHAPDGGRDIEVHAGDPRGPGHFIPDEPSLWSVKSGADGASPTALRREIEPPKGKGWPDHPKVRDALRAGRHFIWCAVHPASLDVRAEMRAEANAIAARLGVGPGLIDFRWQDVILETTNRHPNVIPHHFPGVADRWAGVRFLGEWEREARLDNPWADFGGRPGLVDRVARHLLGRGAPNVLHLAGLSGVGKTRVAFEACRRDERLHGVLYVPRCADLSPELRRAIRATGAAALIVDEASLDDADAVRAAFADCAERVRVVTLGPASRQSAVDYPDLVVIPEPTSADDVLAVIRGPGHVLPEPTLRGIASHSAHDLRLALLLVRATLLRPESQTIPLAHVDGVWKRLVSLFQEDVPNLDRFSRCYEALSVAIDVRFGADDPRELQALAAEFELSERDLLESLSAAEGCGLGIRAGRFFEATPHALAVDRFLKAFRRGLRDRLSDFLVRLPDRLLRRFLERCQEVSDRPRQEVNDCVSRVMLGWLAGADISTLADRMDYRVFKGWVELDPVSGVAWLRRAVESASPEQLLSLDSAPGGSGGWGGRQQLVWLCQNLVGFAEHFGTCEAILFRLARYETEPRIGNNSTAIWRSLFWPVLTPTELPFKARFPALLGRLSAASADDLELVLEAAFAVINPPHLGLGLPPDRVGGRVTPPPWMPATRAELLTYRRDAAEEVLAVVASLADPVHDRARRWIVPHIHQLGYLDVLGAARALYPAAELPTDLRREVVVELDRAIGFHRRVARDGTPSIPAHVPSLEAWRSELAAGDPATRIQDLTARAYHDLWMEARSDAVYEPVADELIAAPATLHGLGGWLGDEAARGAAPLGFTVGRRDTADRLADLVREWLAADAARPFVLGYLNGAAARTGELPDRWAAELDGLASRDPELAVLPTTAADRGGRGLARVLNSVARVPPPASRALRGLVFNGWRERLTDGEQAHLLDALADLADAGDPGATGVGLEVVAYWWHDRGSLDPGFVPVAFRLADRGPADIETHDGRFRWHAVLRFLAPHDPVRVATLVMGVVTDRGYPWRFDDGNAEALVAAARHDPSGVMEVVGRAFLDPDRRSAAKFAELAGLFEAVGVEEASRWAAAHGPSAVRGIARHFESPSLGPGGEVVVPPVTHWLFTERGDDQETFESFLAGRHTGAFFSRDDLVEKTRAAMAPFEDHPLPRVREWAAYEIRHAEQHVEWFRRDDEEDERL